MSLTQQQYGEFLNFLESKITTTKSDFIKAMHERITDGKDLTPNSELNEMSTEQLDEYKERLLGVLKNQTFDMWIPKSQIEEVLIETP